MTDKKKNIEKKQEKPATDSQRESIEQFIQNYVRVYNSKPYTDMLYVDAKKLEQATRQAMESGGYSPQMGQSVMDDFLPVVSKTASELQDYLLNPRQNEETLRQVSRTLETSIMAYARVVSFLNDVKTFKYFLKCDTPGLTQGDIDSEDYQKSKQKAFSTLKSLNIPYQARLLDKKTVSEGLSFWLYYKGSEKGKGFIRFLSVPIEYCYITGPSTSFGYTWAIDLTFLDRMMYLYNNLPELNFAYLKFCKIRAAFMGPKKEYMGQPITEDIVKTVQYYSVPLHEGCVLMFNEASASRIPITAGTMPAALDMISYRSLLKQKATVDLYTMVVHRIPRDEKTGKLLATFAEAEAIIKAIQAISPSYIKHATSIFEEPNSVKMNGSDVINSLTGVGNDQFYESAGMQASLFNESASSEASVKFSMIASYGFASSNMYTYLTNLFNYLLNMENNTKYEWSIHMYGNLLMDQEEQESASKLSNIIGNPYLLLSAYGIEPFNVENILMDDLKKVKKDMIPFKTAATQAKEDAGGRPVANKTKTVPKKQPKKGE